MSLKQHLASYNRSCWQLPRCTICSPMVKTPTKMSLGQPQRQSRRGNRPLGDVNSWTGTSGRDSPLHQRALRKPATGAKRPDLAAARPRPIAAFASCDQRVFRNVGPLSKLTCPRSRLTGWKQTGCRPSLAAMLWSAVDFCYMEHGQRAEGTSARKITATGADQAPLVG